jgi:hypothetical protein
MTKFLKKIKIPVCVMNMTLVATLRFVCEAMRLAAIIMSDKPWIKLIIAPKGTQFIGIMPPKSPIVTK